MRPRSQRNSLNLKQSQVYHLNHIECHPYQGRRSRYSTQSSSFLALVMRPNSANRSIPSTQRSSMAGSHLALRQDSLAGSNPALHQDALASSNPVLRLNSAILSDSLARQQSLSDLQHGTSPNEYRRNRGGRLFRSYLDWQAVRQSYLQAVSQESLLESEQQSQSSLSLSTEVFLSLPLHLVSFLFCSSHAVMTHTKRIFLHFDTNCCSTKIHPLCAVCSTYVHVHVCIHPYTCVVVLYRFEYLPLLPLCSRYSSSPLIY